MSAKTEYDIVISGGGVVGCLAAIALSQDTQLSVGLLEAGSAENPNAMGLDSGDKHAGFDTKVIALSHDSIAFLASCGVNVDTFSGMDIQHIHVSDRGHIGQVHLSAKEQNVDRLGRVVAIKELGAVLLTRLKQQANIDYLCPAHITRAQRQKDYVELDISLENPALKPDLNALKSDFQCRTKLLVLSDGAHSRTAALLKFNRHVRDYHQSAIVTNVQMQMPHNNRAFERFTSQGPVAFLPMQSQSSGNNADPHAKKDHTMSVVWCMHQENVRAISALNDVDFRQRLQGVFSSKLGRVEAFSKAVSYPLALNYVPEFVAHRSICIGNAAQSLHPIAGQGFNLGVRDVRDLRHSIMQYEDVGCFASTNAYKLKRQLDKQMTIQATDTLVDVFSKQYLPFVVGRNLGLLCMNKASLAKNLFAKFAMGYRTTENN